MSKKIIYGIIAILFLVGGGLLVSTIIKKYLVKVLAKTESFL